MKRALYLLTCLPALAACASQPVPTSQRTVSAWGNTLRIDSGTVGSDRFVAVTNTQKTWEGDLKGGKGKWNARRASLELYARKEIDRICGSWFFALKKGPLYRMLDNDETMGGAAPVLGVGFSMAAYLAADAATEDTNVPSSVYMEFTCPSDKT